MREDRSQWRRSDAGAYDALLRAVADATAKLFEQVRHGDLSAEDASRQAFELRELAVGIDGFDRVAVDASLSLVRARTATSESESP